jgi:hypothetical protein
MSESPELSAPLLPDWQELLSTYIETGTPVDVVIQNDPRISVFVDGGGARLGALIEYKDESTPLNNPLAVISVSVKIGSVRYMEISTRYRELYRDFYLLLGELIDSIVKGGTSPSVALKSALSRWQTLLRSNVLLSDERQLGLFGELWVLERLLSSIGAAALDAWVGPLRQEHDFRLSNNEFEVKTTSSARRTHIINGLGQLSPSQNCSLYIVSLQFTLAGAGGRTLAETVAELELPVKKSGADVWQFGRLLELVGYRAGEAQYYSTRRRIGGTPRIIPVAGGCPRLTRESLSNIRLEYLPDRILDAQYRIDVEGLGYQDGDPRFLAVLPV